MEFYHTSNTHMLQTTAPLKCFNCIWQ